MSRDLGIMPGLDEIAIVTGLVLRLAGIFQAHRVDAFHSNKDLCATGLPGLGHKIRDFVGEHIHLHHELNFNLFRLAKGNQGIENGFPGCIASKIIVRKKIEIHPTAAPIFPQGLSDGFR
mgnify:CR=1 FL=1